MEAKGAPEEPSATDEHPCGEGGTGTRTGARGEVSAASAGSTPPPEAAVDVKCEPQEGEKSWRKSGEDAVKHDASSANGEALSRATCVR